MFVKIVYLLIWWLQLVHTWLNLSSDQIFVLNLWVADCKQRKKIFIHKVLLSLCSQFTSFYFFYFVVRTFRGRGKHKILALSSVEAQVFVFIVQSLIQNTLQTLQHRWAIDTQHNYARIKCMGNCNIFTPRMRKFDRMLESPSR